MPAKINLIGRTFGKLKVIAEAQHRGEKRRSLCVCECGQSAVVGNGNLLSGKTRSCGCSKWFSKHGMTQSREYSSWEHIIQRCTNPKNSAFKHYGGRGIKVCERWLAFENFLADMGPRPEGTSIERNNRNGDYEPGNCR